MTTSRTLRTRQGESTSAAANRLMDRLTRRGGKVFQTLNYAWHFAAISPESPEELSKRFRVVSEGVSVDVHTVLRRVVVVPAMHCSGRAAVVEALLAGYGGLVRCRLFIVLMCRRHGLGVREVEVGEVEVEVEEGEERKVRG